MLTEAQLRMASQTYNAQDGSFFIPEVVTRVTGANGGKLSLLSLLIVRLKHSTENHLQ